MLGLLALMRRGRVHFVSALMAALTSLFFVLLSVAFGGVGEPPYSGYIAAVLTAGLLLGGRAGIVSAAFGVGAGLVILLLEVNSLLPPSPMTMTLPFAWFVTSFGFIVGATILHLSTSGTAAALARAHRNERAMHQANEELQREIAERQRTQEALQESEQRYRRIVEEASDAVYTTDLQGRFSYVNLPAQLLSGYSEDELLGMHFTELLPEAWKEKVLSFYQQQFQDRVHDTMLEFPFVTRAGKIRWVEQSVTHLMDDDRVTAFQSIVRDITERVHAEEALRKAHDELERRVEARTAELAKANAELSVEITERKRTEEALRAHTSELQARNEELDAYAHTVAHDLNGPAGIIVGFAEALEDNLEAISPEELRHHLRTIARNGRKMSNITEELLLLASVRQVQDVDMSPLDMCDLVSGALDRLSHLTEELQTQITLPEHWPNALGYGPWVEEVWVNYLSNAIKYGGRPPRVELGATIGQDDSVRFWVRDNGPGLSQDEQARLFTPFSRLDQARAKGHGLGLSIVRRIIEKLGGGVGVDSTGDEGSTFFFSLPSAPP
jgi:PAS domain S-box-containing protein